MTEKEIIARLRMVSIPVVEILEWAELFAFTDPTEKPGTSSIVIAIADEQAFPIKTSDDFQGLLSTHDLNVSSADEALQIAKQYVLVLGTRYPQYWAQVEVLESADDIPLRADETLPAAIRGMIQPPDVQKRDCRFSVRLLTWSELGGELKSYEFDLSSDAKLTVTEDVIANDLGRAWLPK